MKVLLVDDDRSVRMALAMVLENMGVEVVSAVNGEDALQVAGSQSFDLILSDINMPVMDGLEFGGRLRKDRHLVNVPLVYMTGSQPKEFEDEMARLGVVSLLWKPIGLPDLQAVLRRFGKLKTGV